MINKSIKRSLAYGILFLFIGLIISSNISGNIRNINNQIPEKVPINLPLNDDYVIANWKFDEGSGSTLGDTSGHDFDGVINGATWVTGHSGYALDFDGVDDYVAFDEYSEYLGYNKTDDVIYSFWFKSNDEGIIYCISRSWGYNPEHYIKLVSNGSLMFRVWTVECGITFYSKNAFDDGNWHHAQYYFNGVTANPTAELYVDGEFEGNKTTWLCNIYHDDFGKTKMGRHSKYETDYFDGAIDEFIIIKYPGGNKQKSPTISGPTSGGIGEELFFTIKSEDPEGDNISYFMNWGDGENTGWLGPYESGKEKTVSHSWDEEGEYEIWAKAKDYWGDSFPTTIIVRIGNEAPETPEQPSGPALGGIGQEYEFSSSTTDPDGDELYYNWSWDDGNYSGWLGPYASGAICETKYTWNNVGNYGIKVKAKDQYGESGWSPEFQINIVESNINIESITGGLFTIKASIENIGEMEASNINWYIDISGVLYPSNPSWEGTIESISPGESEKIKSGTLIGFGEIVITITVEIADEILDILEKNAFIFFFFILIS